MTTESIVEREVETGWERVQDLGRGVRKAGRNVWLAGLGGIATLGEGGRDLAAELVERGRRRQPSSLEQELRSSGEKIGDRLKSFGERLERGVERRTAATLKHFGVPARDEVRALIDRVEQLTRKIEALTAEK